MINKKSEFYIGVFVFLIPFLGFPTFWKMALVLLAGLILVFSSIKIPVPRRILKMKPKKEIIDNVSTETNIPKQELVTEVIPTIVTTEPKIQTKISEAPPIIKITPTIRKSKKTTKVDSLRKIDIKQK